MPRTKQADKYDSGIAAEYFVLSQLYRKKYDAYLTQGKKKAIDIQVVLKNGAAISIDVKAVRGYSSWPINNIKKKKGHFIVFLAYNNKFYSIEEMPSVYIVPSRNVRGKQTKRGKRQMKGSIEKYKNQWVLLQVNADNSLNRRRQKRRAG